MKLLDGIRVLALEQFGAAPYGSMLLADLGAEVIKIENDATAGDASRHVGPHMLGESDSYYFQTFNFNKKSICLDIKKQAGREQFLSLVAQSDAVINNLRGDQPAKLGIDYASLKSVNPAIVCLHISAYGRDNSRCSWPGYDYLMQAEAGLMSLTGEPDGPPTRLGLSMVDYMTGTVGMVGLLSGIIRARNTGEGCDVDASLFDVALHQLSYPAVWYLNRQDQPKRMKRSAHPSLAPVGTFRTADGWIFIMCMTDGFWERFIQMLDVQHLGQDHRFSTQAGRREHRDTLTGLLDDILVTRPTAEWLEVLGGQVPVAPVYDVAQTFANDFLKETQMVRYIPHPRDPDLKALANPLKINGKRPSQRACSALGADNEAYLSDSAAQTRLRSGDR
jgi:crotonobetainyl-CoA:carnitine CoA-transferase CaiB-like acyl-CoA transferase